MKNLILPALCLLLAADLTVQGIKVYQQYTQRAAPIVRNASPNTTVNLANRIVDGNPSATAVIVEFSDYECPYCIRHATSTLPSVRQKLVGPGRARYAFINNPLPVHPHAQLLATAALCASRQDKFWAMHDRLFEKQPKETKDITTIAGDLSINGAAFQRCLEDSTVAQQIQNDMKLASQLGLSSTPSFAVGVLKENGDVSVRKLIRGAQSLDVFEKAVSDVSRQ
jgi:protein-disulfide isomerase